MWSESTAASHGPIEATDAAASDAFAHNIALLNEHVFAPLDYAVVARRQ